MSPASRSTSIVALSLLSVFVLNIDKSSFGTAGRASKQGGDNSADPAPTTDDGAILAVEAASVGALGIVRAIDGRATVLVARGPEGDAGRARRALDDGPDRPQAPVVTSAHTRSELAAARRTLDAYAGGSAGQGHAFGIYFDAAVDAIAVVTDTPVDQRQALQASMGKIVDVRYGTGNRS